MNDLFRHSIAGSSAFFQGYIGQFFSERGLFYKITSNEVDPEATERVNAKKFRPIFAREINSYIAVSHDPSRAVSPDEIRIAALRLVNDRDWDDYSGIYQLYPHYGICLKKGCGQYFDLKKGRTCSHKDTDPVRQLTFLAFCEDCGKVTDLHYASNLGKDCPKCSSGSLIKLRWTIAANLLTYSVSCTSCGYTTKLYPLSCDHRDSSGRSIISKDPTKFTFKSARAGTVSHPVVMVLPDVPSKDQVNAKGGINIDKGSQFSGAFAEEFGKEVEEGIIFHPFFIDELLANMEFWESSEVSHLCKRRDFTPSSPGSVDNAKVSKLVKNIIEQALNDIDDGMDRDEVRTDYGLTHIKTALDKVSKRQLRSKDIYGFVLDTHPSSEDKGPNMPKMKDEPESFNAEEYEAWKARFGLQKVSHLSNVRMIQALLGVMKGSVRKDKTVFELITTKNGNKRDVVTVYIQEYFTEGVKFELDHAKVIDWLEMNKGEFGITTDLNQYKTNPSASLSNLLGNDQTCKAYVEKLLHTYSHMLIHQSSLYTGLSVQSLAEELYPLNASIFIYSTNTVNIGGLEYTYDNRLLEWTEGMIELAKDCPQDPACMVDEGGACNACSFVPEFVCERFNQDLDRSFLVGGSDRVKRGYLE